MASHHNESKGGVVLGVCIAFTVLAIGCTVLRLCTRFGLLKNAGLEDYCITLATLFSLLLTILIGEQVHYGMGRHFDTLSEDEYAKSLKPFWVSVWIYYLALTFTKVSILIQYYRLLIYRKTRIAIWVMAAVVVGYGIATVLDSIFLCQPVAYFWDTSLQGGSCLDRGAVWYSNAALNIIIDVAIVILPLPAIKSLGLPRRQRWAVAVLFALGGFVCVTSIVRLQSLASISKSKDITWDNTDAATWSSVETNVGILCACLPTLRPLFLRYAPRWFSRHPLRNSQSMRGGAIPASNVPQQRQGAIVANNDMDKTAAASPGVKHPYALKSTETNGFSSPRTMYFSDSQDSIGVDADLEALCTDGWTQNPPKAKPSPVQD